MKVSELSGAMLDYWVAKAEGAKPVMRHKGIEDDYGTPDDTFVLLMGPNWYGSFEPSSKWMQGGPIIQENHISVGWCYASKTWQADCPRFKDGKFVGRVQQWSSNDDPLVAAMRCFVASRFGDEVGE